MIALDDDGAVLDGSAAAAALLQESGQGFQLTGR